MSDNPQTGWTSGSYERASDIPVDEEKERALRKRQEESKALLDAAIAPLVEEYEKTPEVEPEDERDLEEMMTDMFMDSQSRDRKRHAGRVARMAARGRDEFGRPLSARISEADVLYKAGIGVSPEELARFEAHLDSEEEEYGY